MISVHFILPWWAWCKLVFVTIIVLFFIFIGLPWFLRVSPIVLRSLIGIRLNQPSIFGIILIGVNQIRFLFARTFIKLRFVTLTTTYLGFPIVNGRIRLQSESIPVLLRLIWSIPWGFHIQNVELRLQFGFLLVLIIPLGWCLFHIRDVVTILLWDRLDLAVVVRICESWEIWVINRLFRFLRLFLAFGERNFFLVVTFGDGGNFHGLIRWALYLGHIYWCHSWASKFW